MRKDERKKEKKNEEKAFMAIILTLLFSAYQLSANYGLLVDYASTIKLQKCIIFSTLKFTKQNHIGRLFHNHLYNMCQHSEVS